MSGAGFPADRCSEFEYAVEVLGKRVPNRIELGPVIHNDRTVVYQVIARFAELGIVVKALPISLWEYSLFCARAGYSEFYPGYAGANLPEKSLEHFLASSLLQPSSDDMVIDFVPEDSPFASIVSRLSGAKAVVQDSRPDAAASGTCLAARLPDLPVPDAFASKASLISFLNHCEGDLDVRLFRELARVIRPNGRVVVLPLYMFTEPTAQTDPVWSAEDVKFDPDVSIHCVEGWGNRHSRFYSPQTLAARILQFNDQFRFTIYHVLGAEHVKGDIYMRFALLAERI